MLKQETIEIIEEKIDKQVELRMHQQKDLDEKKKLLEKHLKEENTSIYAVKDINIKGYFTRGQRGLEKGGQALAKTKSLIGGSNEAREGYRKNDQ